MNILIQAERLEQLYYYDLNELIEYYRFSSCQSLNRMMIEDNYLLCFVKINRLCMHYNILFSNLLIQIKKILREHKRRNKIRNFFKSIKCLCVDDNESQMYKEIIEFIQKIVN